MRVIDQIHEKLRGKEKVLGDNHEIITPESGVSAEIQAKWMIKLLQFMYIEHGVAKSPDQVVKAIASGDCRCWFILESGEPVAMTALVRQSDGAVELGRAIAITPRLGLGGIAMMRAGLDQLEHGKTPLVAEVRVADEFERIPSGEATQRVLFGLFNLKPHALVPMFNHGIPVRQEMFALATSQNFQSSDSLMIPDNRYAQQNLVPAIELSRNLFSGDAKLHKRESKPKSFGFELVQSAPFSLIVPSDSGASLNVTEEVAMKKNNFSLLPIELNPKNVNMVLTCLEKDWVPCGVDRNLGADGHPVLLLGKLRKGTLLAPAKIVEANMDSSSAKALRRVDSWFRC